MRAAFSGLSWVAAFYLLVDDTLFAALWRRGVPLVLYTVLFATCAVVPLALLAVPIRRGVRRALFQRDVRREGPAPADSALVRRPRKAATLLLGAAALLMALRGLLVVPPGPQRDASREAQALLREVLRASRELSLWRDTVSWQKVEDSAAVLLNGARTARDAYPAARYVLGALGDGHSGLEEFTPSRRPRLTARAAASKLPIARMEPGGVAYVEVPWFVSGLTDRREWTESIAQGIRRLDRETPCGWIVDLRRNFGGDMWPMLDGIAPLLPDGIAGGVAMPRRSTPVHWWIVNGRAYSAVPVLAGLDFIRGSRRLRNGAAPVAVLLDAHTASSGEAVAIAFVGRARTRSFGRATAGLTTANTTVSLPDGTRAAITVGVDIDRHGRRYGGAVRPDVAVLDSAMVRSEAATWLRATCAQVPPNHS